MPADLHERAAGLLIASFDIRQRHLNVVARLEQLHLPVRVWHDAGLAHGRGARLIRGFFSHQRPHTLVIVGAELPAFMLALLSGIFWRCRIVLQLGGDPIEVPRSLLNDRMRERKYWGAARVWGRIQLARILLRHVDSYICVSAGLWQHVRQYTRREAKVIVVPPVFRPSQMCRSCYDGPIRQLLTVTNLNYREKFEGIVSALNGIALFAAGREQPVHYHIVGGGRFLEQLQDYVRQHTWPNLTIDLVGFVDNVSCWYEKADVLVYFSTLDAWPNVLVEGQCHGLPIIANAYPPFKEVLIDEENCLFVTQSDQLALKLVLDRLDSSPALRRRIGEANLAKCDARSASTELSAQIARFLWGPCKNEIA